MKEVTSNEDGESSRNVESAASSSSARAAPLGSVALISLVPHYQDGQHRTYVNRLEEAINEPKNLNIALTGRYGAGKSSVLDKFEENHKSTTLRLAISTLGPNDEGATLTNRIQKELVKQLVYSATPRAQRNSRFFRRVELPWWRAAIEVAALVSVVGVFFVLMGWLPLGSESLFGSHPLLGTTVWVSFAALLVVGGTSLRLATHDRFMISDISAGGATVKLSERTPTYFDEYLDDIVNYFDTEDVDIVIFEDLDRFDDSHIFEALRELNTLLNHTKVRIKKGTPLRFVYAVRDSLFEKLGADTKIEGDDAAAAETVRANRTKFFDIVIPMVPFISHRNARDLLTGLLKNAGVVGIDRSLISLVARYSTDMRLLQNICNEYLVFAERLLESEKVAPGLTPSSLFALISYKNFHLEDFENISRRTSDLDRLYDFRRELVRSSIVGLERRKRDLISDKEKSRASVQLAQRLGDWLRTFAELNKKQSQYSGWQGIRYVVGEHTYDSSDVESCEFWTAVAQLKSIVIQAFHYGSRNNLMSLSGSDLAQLGPDGMDPDRWREIDEGAAQSELENIDKDIAFLRGAEFADLAAKDQYSLKVTRAAATHTMSDDDRDSNSRTTQESSEAKTVEVKCTFAKLINGTMKSELARDLVRQGFLDRNFALYAAQFYGNFTGVDVANFIVQSVQTNTMEVDYRFTSPGAITNLLSETDDDFTHTKAAYNIDVIDFLLDNGDQRADNVVDHIVTDFDDDAHSFLTSYFTSGARREKLAARLASRPWAGIFHYLIVDDGIPADLRSILVSAALAASDLSQDYNLTTVFNTFIVEHYSDMPVFIQPQREAVVKKIATIVDRVDILIPDLSPIDSALRTFIVNTNRYELTAANLRTALDSDEVRNVSNIAFDYVRQNKSVYEYCLAHPDKYLTAAQNDAATQYIVYNPETLLVALSDAAEKWDDKQLTEFISNVAPQSRLDSLSKVPTSTWPMLADADLFRVSLTNVESYRNEIGSVDEHLTRLLEHVGSIETGNPGDTVDTNGNEIDKETASIAILNVRAIQPATRMMLVQSLNVDLPLSVDHITPEPSDLLARLIENGLVADEAASFTHFQDVGWSAIGPAIAASNNVTSFLTPDLVQGMVPDLLNDAATRDKVGDQVTANLDEYVPEDDPAALTAAARYADKHHIRLTPETVLRIAHAGAARQDVLRLLDTASPAANAQQIVAVFGALDQPYSSISLPGTEFDVAHDELHNRLLTTLRDGKVCTFKKKRSKNLYQVRVV